MPDQIVDDFCKSSQNPTLAWEAPTIREMNLSVTAGTKGYFAPVENIANTAGPTGGTVGGGAS